MKEYKNLVFDVGGVLIEFRPMEMLMDYGLTQKEAEQFGECIFKDPTWEEFDLENISFQDVVDTYLERYPDFAKTTRWFFENASYMAVPRPQVWEKLRELKKAGYRLYLLSNYSSHLFRQHTGTAYFHQYIDGGVISYQIHQVKPNPAIYRHLFLKYSLKPEECLFFDDRQENVEGSLAQGMDAIVVTSQPQLLSELQNLLDHKIPSDMQNFSTL